MTTMTISEAEHIIDIVCTALLQERTSSSGGDERKHYWDYYHKPISILQGYDVFQIGIALNLRIANMFLFLSERNDFEEQFAEAIKACGFPFLELSMCIPDDLMTKLEQLAKLSKTLPRNSPEFLKQELPVMQEVTAIKEGFLKDKNFLALETSESFGNYCKSIGSKDPIYWQKIYTRIGLEYTSSSPKGNDPVSLEP